MCGSVLAVMAILLTFASNDQQNQLAHRGAIEENAPIQDTAEILISASPEKVWKLLTNVHNWPQWQKDISSTDAPNQIQEGTNFTWVTGGSAIHSHIALLEPETRFAWTGTVATAHAIHVWQLCVMPDGKTLITTRESMNGFMLTLLYSSSTLKQSHRHWLDALRTAAESK